MASGSSGWASHLVTQVSTQRRSTSHSPFPQAFLRRSSPQEVGLPPSQAVPAPGPRHPSGVGGRCVASGVGVSGDAELSDMRQGVSEPACGVVAMGSSSLR